MGWDLVGGLRVHRASSRAALATASALDHDFIENHVKNALMVGRRALMVAAWRQALRAHLSREHNEGMFTW